MSTNSSSQGLKRGHIFNALTVTTEQLGEKVDARNPAPKGAIDFEELAASLKRYPDTNLTRPKLTPQNI
jgi:hypothetical protein